VVTQGDGLVVVTAMEMPDWEVRQHRSTLIHFEGQTWRVAVRTVAAGKVHYQLARWDVADHERAGREVDYNAAYVALRDQAAPIIRARNRATGFLRWVSPLVGFLPSRTKARLEVTHGIDPVASTFHSVFLEFLVTFCSFTIAPIGMLAFAGTVSRLPGGPIAPVVLIMVFGILVGIDGSVRYGRILREERAPPGFFEWAFQWRRGVN
jgi:hypothetical protein